MPGVRLSLRIIISPKFVCSRRPLHPRFVKEAIIVHMEQSLLPLFPLNVVLFPRTPLPLHIFEERYKEMIGKAIRDQSEFGIVLAHENGIGNAGCTVTVEKLLQ